MLMLLEAVLVLVTDGGSKQRRCCLKRRREGSYLFPSPLFPSLFFFFFFGFLSPCFPFLSVLSSSSPLSLSFGFFVLLPSLLCFLCFFSPRLSPVFSSSFRVPSSQRSWPLFIEAKGAVFCFYSSHGEQPAGRPLCPVGGLQARVAGKNSKKSNPFSLLPRCVIGGRR